jgi:CRP-like cAMP-binding protein
VRTNIWYELKRQRMRIPYPVRTLQLERRAARPAADDQEEARTILRGDPLFECLTEEQIDTIVKQSRLDHFGRGERVIEEGADGDSMFVLLRGAAQVSVAKNGSSIPVATLNSGDCFGEMSLLTGEKRSATVRAQRDCYVMEISKPVMAEIIREAPDCLNKLSEILARRRMETEGVLKDAIGTDEQAAKEREYGATFLARLRDFFAL